VGGGGGGLPTTPHPLNTSSHKTAARRPPHPSYTQQHTTTLHNSTWVHKTTNVPVVFMALILNGFEGYINSYSVQQSGSVKSFILRIEFMTNDTCCLLQKKITCKVLQFGVNMARILKCKGHITLKGPDFIGREW
jgi:hypothetical protein